MSFVSVHFLIFTAICVAGYFIIPKKWRWIWLLLFSYLYYMAAGVRFLFYPVFDRRDLHRRAVVEKGTEA